MADIMECPIGTVMSRLYRGRQRLQARLQPYAMSQGYIRNESGSLSLLPTDDDESDDDTYTSA
jgi:hypothetical protein